MGDGGADKERRGQGHDKHRLTEGSEEREKKGAKEIDRKTHSIGSQQGPGVISSPHEKCMLGYGITSKGG